MVAVVSCQVVVQRLVVAGDRTTHRGSMGSEECSNAGLEVLEIEQAHGSGPLVEVCYYILLFTVDKEVIVFDNKSRCPGKRRRFVVVAIGGH